MNEKRYAEFLARIIESYPTDYLMNHVSFEKNDPTHLNDKKRMIALEAYVQELQRRTPQ